MSDFPPSHLVEAGAATLEVFTAGAGRPIVLCHGWPEHAYSWRHQMQPLAQAGYQVIAPNQRGYGASSRPEAVEAYDIDHLTGDLIALLDRYGHEEALFVGHDWGAIVVWALALMHPHRMAGLINLSVPFMPRGEREWVGLWEERLGPDFYIVHFNRQPGVADALFAANTERFLRNLYRTGQWRVPPPPAKPGMPLINLAQSDAPTGQLMMSEAELAVFVEAFRQSGFTGGINWYRNFSRNWAILGRYPQRVEKPALMIYGQHDIVPQSDTLADTVPNLEVATLDCGHWIQQEQPQETNRLMLDWLSRHYPVDGGTGRERTTD